MIEYNYLIAYTFVFNTLENIQIQTRKLLIKLLISIKEKKRQMSSSRPSWSMLVGLVLVIMFVVAECQVERGERRRRRHRDGHAKEEAADRCGL